MRKGERHEVLGGEHQVFRQRPGEGQPVPRRSGDQAENGMTENKMCDHYIDYFDTYEEALAWYKQAKNA